MASMYMICLVFVLSLAVVQCNNPDCSTSVCTGGKECKWTCDNGGTIVVGANRSTCATPNQQCGTVALTTGKCKAGCVDPLGTPDCGAHSCSSTEKCKWTCAKSGTTIPGADLEVCAAENSECGSTTLKGQCKSACVSTPDPSTNTEQGTPNTDKSGKKNGSIRHGLSPLMLIFGIVTKLFLLP